MLPSMSYRGTTMEAWWNRGFHCWSSLCATFALIGETKNSDQVVDEIIEAKERIAFYQSRLA